MDDRRRSLIHGMNHLRNKDFFWYFSVSFDRKVQSKNKIRSILRIIQQTLGIRKQAIIGIFTVACFLKLTERKF